MLRQAGIPCRYSHNVSEHRANIRDATRIRHLLHGLFEEPPQSCPKGMPPGAVGAPLEPLLACPAKNVHGHEERGNYR